MAEVKTGSLEAEALTVSLGGHAVLHEVSLSARAGEVTVIAGPNGCGKSTLIRALCREISSRGGLRINGRDMRGMKAWQLAALRAVLPQETSVAFPFRVGEIVALGLRAVSHQTPRDLVSHALEAVGLGGFEGREINALSGGERQRVHLARVLTQIWDPVGPDGPRWLILDEPVSSLDIRYQLGVMEIARDYARRGGGVIAVMHDLNLSAMYADRMAFMHKGKVAAFGPTPEVMRAEVLNAVFDCALRPNHVPPEGDFVLPQSVVSSAAPIAIAAE